ncbi:MAG: glycosyltransferase family 4 protein [Solirubrobacteraceae bacterium]|nr:glycosyltransferase family 4 protein [Solirubrobacteraceae bacterium]
MVIGVDARSLCTTRGVWRYVAQMLQALATAFPDDELRLLAPGNAPLFDPPDAPNITIVRPPGRSRVYFGRSTVFGTPRLDEALGGDLDAFWLPASNGCTVSPDVPLVLTVHDLSFEHRPEDFTSFDRMIHRLTRPRAQADGAARIVVHTAAVAGELMGRWDIDPAQIDIIRPGLAHPRWPVGLAGLPEPDPGAVAAVRERHGLPERYVLQVGALEPRKRPDLLLRAHARSRIDADVVFVGAGRLAEQLDWPNAHVLGWVPDDELDLLYAGALALCFPTMLEGFGFPPPEAALRGTPSIVSDLPVLREVLDETARFVPPGDEIELAHALREITEDPAAADALARAAYRRVSSWTWQNAAQDLRRTITRAAE